MYFFAKLLFFCDIFVVLVSPFFAFGKEIAKDDTALLRRKWFVATNKTRFV